MKNTETLWRLLLEELRQDLTPVSIDTWFGDAEPVRFVDNLLALCLPTAYKKDIIEKQFLPMLTGALHRCPGAEEATITLLAGEKEKAAFLAQNSGCSRADRYSFDTFIVGSSNRFAQAAALAVASRPAAAYNPLFIYGPSGLGKTHLLYAISGEIRKTRPSFSIVYIKGDEFANELIGSIQTYSVEAFRQKYRQADLLMVDDIQFIAGKERTQEEFFHTFNTLYESEKQIVLTSDRPPKEMYTLEDRLKTRFEWGLLADIQPPDYETRMAIVSKKAESLGFSLPLGVREYLAEEIRSNVRQLEGAVKKLCALKELMNEEITLRLAEQAVADMARENPGLHPTPALILNEVASVYNVSAVKLTGNSRTKELALPRQVAMYLTRSLTSLSLPDIGREFNRDHSTVLHAINKIEEQMQRDPELSGRVRDLIKNIENR